MSTAFLHLDITALFNCLEAGWWWLMAVAVLAAGTRFRGTTLPIRWCLAVFFALFGVSDVIEVQTGAWWRPLGLLILKGICVVGLVTCAAVVLRNRRRKQSEPRTTSDLNQDRGRS